MSAEDEGAPVPELGGTQVLTVTVYRQPVLKREQETHKGKLRIVRSAKSYVRTKEPLEERTEQVRKLERTRVTVSWGWTGGPVVATAQFSIRNARMVGNANWVLSKESLKALRAMAREKFPDPVVEDEKSPLEIAECDEGDPAPFAPGGPLE